MILGRDLVGEERRAYTIEEINERRRTETLWREFGPRTILPSNKTDFQGNLIDAKKNVLYSRLSKIHRSLISSIERNLWEAKPKLSMFSSKLNLPVYVRDTAWKIYATVAKRKLTMGRTIDGFIAASLYAAIRIHEFPKLLEDVHNASMTPMHTIIHSLGMIVKEVLPILKLRYKPITANQLIYRFGSELKLPIETQKEAHNMLSRALKNGMIHIGKDPKGLAASVLYMAAKDFHMKKTQMEVAEVAKITEVTLRARIKDLRECL